MNATDNANITRIAREFEGVFLNQMMQSMMATVPQAKGAMGGGQAENMWRGMMAEEMARATARAGGIGIADALRQQMVR